MLDMGRVCCGKTECAKIVDGAMRHFDGDRLALISSVVMPNHVHALFVQNAEYPLEHLLHSWKSFSSQNRKSIGRTVRSFMAKKLLRSSGAGRKTFSKLCSLHPA